MNYEPAPVPSDPKQLTEYLTRELRRFGSLMRDESQVVHYLTMSAQQGSLTDAISANWKHADGNVILVSTSNTVTITGLAYKVPNRSRYFVNVGHGVLVLNSQDVASSESYRFALSDNWNLSANASAHVWYDPHAFRWRGLSRT